MKRRTGARLGALSGHLLLGLSTLLMVTYFLGVGQPGRAMITVLAAGEINGAAEVGQVQLDPLSASAALFDVEVRTADGKPAAKVGSVEVAASSLLGNEFSRLAVSKLQILLALDEEGRFNLDEFFVEKPDTGPKEPSGLRIDALSLEEAEVSLTTPDLMVEVGPVTAVGAVEQPVGQSLGGRVEGRIEAFRISPKSKKMEDLIGGIVGPQSPLVVGPLDAKVHWGEGNVDVRSVQLTWGSLELYLQGQVDYERLAGTLSLMGTRDGKQVGSLLVRRQGEDWAFSMQVSEANLPGRQGESLVVPTVELSGLALSALPGQISLKLNRFSTPHLDLDGARLAGISLSGSAQYESAQPLHGLVEKLASGKADVADVAANWVQGDAIISLLVESITKGDKERIAPLRFRVEAKRTKDDKMRWIANLTLHPHGTIRAELTADLSNREGFVPYVAKLHIDGLETEALLDLLPVPGLLHGMVTGRLEGSIELAAHDLASTTVKVPHCRFDLIRAEGDDMVVRTPDDQQIWDFGVAPSFSFFGKELKFGDGKLVMQVQPKR
jgi:hypothetical protein